MTATMLRQPGGAWLLGHAVAITLAIAYLALWPEPVPLLASWWDKVKHALAFGYLLLAWRLALRRGSAGWLAVAVFVYGAAIEAIQELLPARFAEGGDLLANACGIAAVWLVWASLARLHRRRRGRQPGGQLRGP